MKKGEIQQKPANTNRGVHRNEIPLQTTDGTFILPTYYSIQTTN